MTYKHRPIHIGSLTNFAPSERDERIYIQAADDTGFPCWVEHFPMPREANLPPPGTEGARLHTILENISRALQIPLPRWQYDPIGSLGLWSLWTEWKGDDHTPFWERVFELKKKLP